MFHRFGFAFGEARNFMNSRYARKTLLFEWYAETIARKVFILSQGDDDQSVSRSNNIATWNMQMKGISHSE